MEFKISAARRKELAQIEAESICDIGAGFDLGKNVDKFYASYLRHTPASNGNTSDSQRLTPSGDEFL
jgi:hypothetical protein